MKKIFTALYFLAFIFSPQAQTAAGWYSIKAFLPQWKEADTRLWVDGILMHSGKIEQDLYSYTAAFREPQIAVLELRKEKKALYVPLFIEKGVVKVKAQSTTNVTAYATPLNDRYNELLREMDSLISAKVHLSLADMKSYRQHIVANFVRHQPASLISLKLLYDHFYLNTLVSDTGYHTLFYSLDEKLRSTASGQKMAAEVKMRYAAAVGRPAPMLQLPDEKKQPKPLVQSGKITLVHFWASWCASCRHENPALKALIKEYSEKGLELISVSLDRNPALWQKAIQKDGLWWPQLSDLKGWEGAGVKAYGIKSVPALFLIDAQGTIAGKELTLETLEQKLKEMIK